LRLRWRARFCPAASLRWGEGDADGAGGGEAEALS